MRILGALLIVSLIGSIIVMELERLFGIVPVFVTSVIIVAIAGVYVLLIQFNDYWRGMKKKQTQERLKRDLNNFKVNTRSMALRTKKL
tara:strand:+ start:2480 stop:2743 length:264 start_codon:yes stop_codon:yes gene_type:complete